MLDRVNSRKLAMERIRCISVAVAFTAAAQAKLPNGDTPKVFNTFDVRISLAIAPELHNDGEMKGGTMPCKSHPSSGTLRSYVHSYHGYHQ
jgi:hypothetical protein